MQLLDLRLFLSLSSFLYHLSTHIFDVFNKKHLFFHFAHRQYIIDRDLYVGGRKGMT